MVEVETASRRGIAARPSLAIASLRLRRRPAGHVEGAEGIAARPGRDTGAPRSVEAVLGFDGL
jgi:hypothetical protein